jgi:hypothetical protein
MGGETFENERRTGLGAKIRRQFKRTDGHVDWMVEEWSQARKLVSMRAFFIQQCTSQAPD